VLTLSIVEDPILLSNCVMYLSIDTTTAATLAFLSLYIYTTRLKIVCNSHFYFNTPMFYVCFTLLLKHNLPFSNQGQVLTVVFPHKTSYSRLCFLTKQHTHGCVSSQNIILTIVFPHKTAYSRLCFLTKQSYSRLCFLTKHHTHGCVSSQNIILVIHSDLQPL